MRVTIEIDNKSEFDKLSELFKELKIDMVNVTSSDNEHSALTKGDKSIDPTALFGIWSEQPRTIADIRKTAWQKD